jgi:lysine-N-methylase
MSQRKRTVLAPQYMKSFRCIGTSCEDSCCIGWRVDIDHETYKKYRNIKGGELSLLLEKNVTRNRSATKSEGNYARIKLAEGGICPFLDHERLCKIQHAHGEGYLSDVCTTYPRAVNLLNGIMERSAAMSCPEAARIALLQPEPMEFDEEEEPAVTRNIIQSSINTHEPKFADKAQKHFWRLRIFSISVLQDRRYTLGERLVILGIFYDRVREAIKKEKADEIPDVIAAHANMLEDGSLKVLINRMPAKDAIQMKLLKEIADRRYFSAVSNKRYLECFSEFLHGIRYTADSTVEEIGQRYHEAWQDYYEPYMREHEYILENYLVNYIFKNFFPFTAGNSVFDSYMMLVIHYALIKMHLIGMAGFQKGLTDELVIKLIQSFAKTVEHNQLYVNEIAALMKQNDFSTMAYMSVLIRN